MDSKHHLSHYCTKQQIADQKETPWLPRIYFLSLLKIVVTLAIFGLPAKILCMKERSENMFSGVANSPKQHLTH